MGWLVRTRGDVSLLVLRLALAFVLFPHGAQKVLGWFTDRAAPFATDLGHLQQTVDHMGATFGIQPWMAWVTMAVELLGSLALALGLLGRLAALGVMAIMAGAAWTSSLSSGPFLDWWILDGNGLAGGVHVLAFAAAFAVLLRGSGPLSIDRVLTRRADAAGPI